jgi:ABC-2 type transport system permease protein
MVVKKKTADKSRILLETGLGIILFVLLAYISSFVFARFDLTEEKRHTLTPTTIRLVESLDDVVYIKVFLEGDFPADYQRLRQAIKEKLDEMRAYSGDKIQYEFINPSAAEDKKSREEMYGELVKKGLKYSPLQIREKDGVSEKIIFPGALVSYKNKELPLQILQNRQRATDAEMVNRTINNLEFALVNAIYEVQREETPRIAILDGHGELSEMEIKDVQRSLEEFYKVERVVLDGQVNALSKNIGGTGERVNKYDAIIIAKPTETFSEEDKYLIDQFIMSGGKALWLVDPMFVEMDSLQTSDLTMSTPLRINLDDMLFNYGVRLNRDILIDRTCAPISLVTGPSGNERNELFPWYFQPILVSENPHPIVANLDPIKTDFISSIDTVEAEGITKRIILTTSPYTRILKSPVRVSLNIVSINPDFGNANRPNQPVAVLLEGEFTSNYVNRLPPEFLSESVLDFKEKSPFTRMLVVSDGDIARNPVSSDGRKFRSVNFDPVLNTEMYGNREFIINALNYLIGDASLIEVRSRTTRIRKLDDEKVLTQRAYWQTLNIALPVVITILFGLLQWFWRKKRYAKKS